MDEMLKIEEMQSLFEAIKEVDSEGREWWNSRKLARLMGYQISTSCVFYFGSSITNSVPTFSWLSKEIVPPADCTIL